MLERAGTCLDTTTRHVVRRATRAISSRRMLHSAFWHHGAGDLDLPVWWATVLQPIACALNGGPSGCARQHQLEFGMLEFLYPPKTLALMRRLSKLGTELAVNKYQAGARRYSSARNQTTLAAEATAAQETAAELKRLNEENEERAADDLEHTRRAPSISALPSHLIQTNAHSQDQHGTIKRNGYQALRELQQCFESPIPSAEDGKAFEKIWQLYLQLTTDHRSAELQRNLLNYLSFSNRQEEKVRSALLLNKLDENVFWKDILQSLHRGAFDDAIATHNFAINTQSDGYIGSNVLLAHAVQQERWDAALHVFNSRMASFALRGHKAETTQFESSIWYFVDRLPNLEALVSTYIDNATLQVDEPQTRDFLRNLASCVLMNGHLSQLSLRKTLIQKLKALDFVDAGFYEAIITTILGKVMRIKGDSPLSQYREARKYFFHLYHEYRKSLTGPPKLDILYDVLRILNHKGIIGKIEVRPQAVEHDFRELGLRIPAAHLINLLSIYARSGDTASVHRCHDEFSQKGEDGPFLRRSLITVHAKRAEPVEAQRQFDCIFAETGQRPNIGCWNSLLNAYVQADDLEGALRCFSRLEETALKLDYHSFAPILQLFAERGEPGKVIQYLETAKQHHVMLTADMFSCLVLAHIKNENLPAAEEALKALVEARATRDLEGSLTRPFTYLLTAYATRRDLENVLRLFKQMQENDISSDSATYGALVQVLCLTHQTLAAQKLVDKVMPEKCIPVLPFHYSLIMAGYHRQDQRAKALAVLERMDKLGIKPDASVKTAYLRSSSLRALQDFESDDRHEFLRRKIEQRYGALLDSSDAQGAVTLGPTLGLSNLNPQNISDAYFETLLMNYGKAGMAEMVRKLAKEYEDMQAQKSGGDKNTSLRVLGSLITAYSHFEDLPKVQEYWERYVEIVAHLFQNTTRTRSSNHEEHNANSSTTENSGSHAESAPPSLRSLENIHVPPSRRSIFSRPLVPYIRSLAAQHKYELIYTTIYSLLNAGFTFDNLAWNEYVKDLAQSHNPAHIITAFRACEEKLMPNFPGWVKTPRQAKLSQRRSMYARSFEYMEVRMGREQLWLGLLRPQFQTLLELRSVLEKIERAEIKGDQEYEWTPGAGGNEASTKAPESGDGVQERPNPATRHGMTPTVDAQPRRKVVLTADGMALVAPLTVRAAQTIPEIALNKRKWWPRDEKIRAGQSLPDKRPRRERGLKFIETRDRPGRAE